MNHYRASFYKDVYNKTIDYLTNGSDLSILEYVGSYESSTQINNDICDNIIRSAINDATRNVNNAKYHTIEDDNFFTLLGVDNSLLYHIQEEGNVEILGNDPFPNYMVIVKD